MLVRVNSKRGKYEPAKWMLDGKRLESEHRAGRSTTPMSGADVLARFRAMGIRVIDKRADKTAVIS